MRNRPAPARRPSMTKIKKITGMSMNEKGEAKKEQIIVRFTSDELGETISLSTADTMLLVPFEPVKTLINDTRKGGRKHGFKN